MEIAQLVVLVLIWFRLWPDAWHRDIPDIFTKVRQIKGSLSVIVPHAENIDLYIDQQRASLEKIDGSLHAIRTTLDEIKDKLLTA